MSETKTNIGNFVREILNKPVYPYQETIGNAILDSILQNKGLTFSIMLSRQMGKNELSAALEAYLLAHIQEGTIVKAAPTFRPQIITSRLRLWSMLRNSELAERAWHSDGYMIGLAPGKEQRTAKMGPRVQFFSAGPGASIVGATASLLLEIDEAQDVEIDKFDRDLRPMASTTNSTTVLYGTAWSDETLLAQIRAHNLELEQRDGIKRHFEYDWRTLAAINPHYKKFVESEIARLGEDHITIRTQYRLLPISGAGFLLNEMQRYLLRGSHSWETEPDDEANGIYVAGMDVGGEERPQQDNRGEGQSSSTRKGRDSTVITIGKVTYNDLMLPGIEIVHQYWWTGKHHLEQYAEATAICERWGICRLLIDRTGLGEVMASLLEAKLGSERVIPFQFTRPSKSKLTYHFLSLINSGRLKMYSQQGAPGAIYDEAWKQLRLARYSIPAPDQINMYVAPEDGHDDFLISIALCCEAVKSWSAPAIEAYIVRPRRLYENESQY